MEAAAILRLYDETKNSYADFRTSHFHQPPGRNSPRSKSLKVLTPKVQKQLFSREFKAKMEAATSEDEKVNLLRNYLNRPCSVGEAKSLFQRAVEFTHFSNNAEQLATFTKIMQLGKGLGLDTNLPTI